MYEDTFERLLNRPTQSHKYDFGHVLVWGGSPGMVGAPFLAAQAALRVGAGLVTIASTSQVVDKLEKRVVELMTLALPPQQPEAAVLDFIKNRKVSAIVAGPGMQAGQAGSVRNLLMKSDLPIILDGGGLNALVDNLDLLNEKIILTPHLGEFKKIFNEALPENREALREVAQKFAAEHQTTLILKGHPTYVAHFDGSVHTNSTGGPALATAGAGDVLTGVIAGLVAQDIKIGEAAEAAVYLHGLAGDIAAAHKTEPGLIASDVIEAIPEALRSLSRSS